EDHPGARIGTCGYARTAMQISIQNDQGEEVPAGRTGEICVCGLAVFAGYYNNPEANAKAFRDGWFRTGDLGYVDEAGYLFITGRSSDMYISGGSNVYPREAEEILLSHPAIAQAAIVGAPDPIWGEIGICVCVLRPGHAIGEAELSAWLAPKIARYKLPKRIFFWSDLPKSGYGKITKKLILDELRTLSLIGAELANDRSARRLMNHARPRFYAPAQPAAARWLIPCPVRHPIDRTR
ncbi:MAG TPA: AMP-binding protein, partial [Acetobacteraceae bacterium]|nr:AMP-binding protein [Acetobacteraceae bacterium]